jgi:hypothetical protein
VWCLWNSTRSTGLWPPLSPLSPIRYDNSTEKQCTNNSTEEQNVTPNHCDMTEEEPINPRATMDAIKSLQLPSPHISSVVTAIEDLKLSTQAMYADQTSPSGEGHTANPSTPLVLYPSSRLCTWGSWLLKTPFSDYRRQSDNLFAQSSYRTQDRIY